MLKKIKSGILIFILFSSINVLAKQEAFNKDTVQANLKTQFPTMIVDEVAPGPIDGLYEVMANGNVFYLSADGRYIFSGDIIDLKNNQKNITEATRKAERIKAISKFGESNMIVFSPKKPKYQVTVFTDVDCGYCRKFHSEIAKINELGIAVRYVAFPRSGPNSPTADKMQSIWCAKDKQQALTLATQDKFNEKNACPSTAVKEGFAMGMRLGVRGTPTLVLEEGTLLPGYFPPNKLLEVLKKVHEQPQK